MIYSFPAHIFKDERSYGVEFPDIPGCFSLGVSVDEAISNAAEALSLHLEGFLEDGEPIPEASQQIAIERPGDIYAMITCEVDGVAARSAG